MAFDPGTGQLILFGGTGTTGALADTWTWNGITWTQLHPAASPTARANASMAYDPGTGQLVLFGGADASGSQADTWTWNGTTWTQQSPGTSPGARISGAMAYDPATGQLVLFGGTGTTGALADTWTWNGTTWAPQSPGTSPTARAGASMAYDPATGQLVLFGGSDASGPEADTWNWDGTTWAQQSTPTSPGARASASMAYDPATGQLILFGGSNSNNPPLGDTWTWGYPGGIQGGWAQQTPGSSPPARGYSSMAYDPATGQLVLFGGFNSNSLLLPDTWTWDGTTWTLKSPTTSPGARASAAMAYDPGTGQLILFGGFTGTYASDTWAWNGTTWTKLTPASSPPGRDFASMAYDPATGQLILFGGEDANGHVLGDTWAWDGTNWTQQSPTNGPARDLASMAYDSGTGQLVLFGGDDAGGNVLADTWTWDGTNWTKQSPAASPPARAYVPMAFDAGNGELVLFGGFGGSSGILGDTWTWNGTTWAPSPPSAPSPSPRYIASMAYDPATDQLVLFGGATSSAPIYVAETWTWGMPGLAAQSIAFTSSPNQPTYGQRYSPAATGGASGNPVLFSLDPSSSGACSINGSTVSFVGTGQCVIDANQAGSNDYLAAPTAQQSFTVAPAPLTITASSPTVTAGAAVPVIIPSYSGFVNGDSPSSLTTAPQCGTTATSSSPPGTYPSTCLGAVDPNYQITYSGGTVTIVPAAQAISFTSSPPGAPTYGGSYAPAATGGASGNPVLFSLDPSSSGACSINGSTVSFVGTGQCVIDANQAGSNDYLAAPTAQQSFTVAPAPLTITASSPTVTAGAAVPVIIPSYSGFVNGDSPSSLTTAPQCGTTATSSSPPGTYPSTCLGAVDPNYQITYGGGTVTIVPAAQSITFTSSPSKPTYGGPSYSLAASATSGLPVSFTTASGAVCTVNGSMVSFVGTGQCVIDADQAGNNDYLAAPTAQQSFTVAPAPLTITASSPTIMAGTTPVIEPIYSGFVNGDGKSSLTTLPQCGTSATNSSPPGSYPTTCANASGPNYQITYVAGTLTVLLAPPGAPGAPVAIPGAASAVVKVTAPTTGGTAASFTVTAADATTASHGGQTCTVAAPAGTCTVSAC